MRLGKVLALVLITLLLVGLFLPTRPYYRTARTLARIWPTPAGVLELSSTNFHLVSDGARWEAELVLQQLEEDLAELRQYLVDLAPKPIVVRLHHAQSTLQLALGGVYGDTLGAYRLGRLELLAPTAWLPQLEAEAALAYYAQQGPVVHELTHLLLDYQARSSYPHWFSEGLAQYWEMRLRDYVWLEGGDDWQENPFTLLELTDRFSQLPENAAYQQSLSLVHFLYERLGEAAMARLLQGLERGVAFVTALEAAYDGGLLQIEEDWCAAIMLGD